MKTTLINATSGSDTMSMMSGFDDGMSIDSRPDSNYKFDQGASGIDENSKEEESKDINNIDAVEIPNKKTIGQIRRRLTANAKRA
jgi:hypothetical protein